LGLIERECRAPKSFEGIGPGFFLAHAGGKVLRSSRFNVIAQLFVDFTPELFRTENVGQTAIPRHVLLLRKLQDAGHRTGQGGPVLFFPAQLLAASCRNGVVTGPAIVLRDAPFGTQPARLRHPV